MQADFWHQRWANNQIGFHQPEANPYLQRYWPGLGLEPTSKVLVPLCGKSLDLNWLAGQGHHVLGVELSEKAVREFFSEQGLQPLISQQGAFKVYSAGPFALWCGDFFSLSAGDIVGCTAFYDRAALIALPPALRERYVAHLNHVLPIGCKGLLVTLDYDQDKIDGPPFSVPDDEVQGLLASVWAPHVLEACDVLEQSPKFLKSGVERLQERVYRLDRR
jgi:thiopurine S-methyltransferase